MYLYVNTNINIINKVYIYIMLTAENNDCITVLRFTIQIEGIENTGLNFWNIISG